MRRLRLILGLLITLSVSTLLLAQESNRAALVIVLAEGEVVTQCVAFTEPEISGYDLLARAGLSVQTDTSGLGTTVCQIEETGCPANNCFCACKGGSDCLYWSYWHEQQGEWQYAQTGATTYMVEDGAVEGWMWGPGQAGQAESPPDMAFEEICALPPATAETAEAVATMPAAPTADPTPASPPPPPENNPASGNLTTWGGYLLFGLLLLGLLGIWIRNRRA